MKNRKIPMRSCVITKEKLPKNELLRIVRDPNGVVVVDTTGKINGRGAYICDSVDCLKKAIKSKGLERSFKVEIPQDIYDVLSKEMI